MGIRSKETSRGYILASFSLTLLTLVTTPLHNALDLANIVMLYLLVVFIIALKLGRGPAIMSAVLAVLLFDFFFVPPRLTFAVEDIQYLVTFAVMLAVGLITTHLTVRLAEESERAIIKEQQTDKLYQLARELAGVGSKESVTEVVKHYMPNLGYKTALYFIDDNKDLPKLDFDLVMKNLALGALDGEKAINIGQFVANGLQGYILPVKSASRIFGVMIAYEESELLQEEQPSNVHQLEAISNLVAIVLERLYYAELAQANQLEATSERLRSSILAALSHDLRTPLTALVGMADALVNLPNHTNDKAKESAAAIREQARTMNSLLSNLLDMARLHAGKVELRKEWQPLEEVIGTAIKLIKPALGNREIKVDMAPDLPLVHFDAVLLERVLCNLMENAAKYSPPDKSIQLKVFVKNSHAYISVRDKGAGFPTELTKKLFQMFSRGDAESNLPGVGLGLAICKAIMDAHQGTITVENHEGGGALVTIGLPLGTAPELPIELE